jgi:hypothetical protein
MVGGGKEGSGASSMVETMLAMLLAQQKPVAARVAHSQD